MTLPYELHFSRHLWRIEATDFGGSIRVSIWPFYAAHDGSIRAGRGGLQFPIEQAGEVAAAILAAAAQFT